ncbi:patellin-2-like [Miscanthus floridulus]|uniref:patellin-2-like n=1 Tax=Miscanthus floridulus TaxID=154761 RepID=UPI00345900B9
MVEGWLRSSGLTPFTMRPSQGYLSLGMRDVRASLPPVPEDAEQRAVNRAHAEVQKKWKDTEEAKCKRKILECKELEKHRRQQRHNGLLVESSPSSSFRLPRAMATRASRKHQAEVPALAPRKALKVSTSSTAQWVVEVQTAIQHGAALARADPKELVAQGEATEVATKQAEEEEPTPREAKAHESDGAEAPLVAEATEGEAKAPRTSEAKAMEARAPRTTEAEVVGTGAPATTEAEVVEAGVSAAKVGEGGALHAGIKRALAVISSHYASVDLEAISDSYVLAKDDEEANEEVTKLMEAAESPGTVLAKLFEEEVVPPTPSANAGNPEP